MRGYSHPVKVKLQERHGSTWKTIGSSTTRTTYALRVPTAKAGTVKLRVITPGAVSRTMRVSVVPRKPVWPTVTYAGTSCVKGKDGQWRWVSRWKATGGIYVDVAANTVPGTQSGLITWVPVTSTAKVRTWRSQSMTTTHPGAQRLAEHLPLDGVLPRRSRPRRVRQLPPALRRPGDVDDLHRLSYEPPTGRPVTTRGGRCRAQSAG